MWKPKKTIRSRVSEWVSERERESEKERGKCTFFIGFEFTFRTWNSLSQRRFLGNCTRKRYFVRATNIFRKHIITSHISLAATREQICKRHTICFSIRKFISIACENAWKMLSICPFAFYCIAIVIKFIAQDEQILAFQQVNVFNSKKFHCFRTGSLILFQLM